MTPTEQLIHDLSDAAYGADAVLKSGGLRRAIAALRATGSTALADELEANAADASAKIREARIAGGFIPRD